MQSWSTDRPLTPVLCCFSWCLSLGTTQSRNEISPDPFFLHLLIPLELVSQNLGTLLEPPFFGMKTTCLVPSRSNQSIKNLGNKLPHIGVNKYFSSFQNAKSKANKKFNYENHTMKYIHPEAFPIETQPPKKHVFVVSDSHPIPSFPSLHPPSLVLRIGLWSYGTILNGLTELFIHWLSLQVDTSLGGRYLECFPKDVCVSYKLKETLQKIKFPRMKSPNRKILGLTWAERRLCLLGDLAKQVTLDSSATVSR